MSNFECTICNYTTKDKSNINRHMKSVKHLQKVSMGININILQFGSNDSIPKALQNSPKLAKTPKIGQNRDKYTCDFCQNVFSRMCNLTRHTKICAHKNNEVDKLRLKLLQYERDMEKYKDHVDHYKEEVDHYKEETNYYKQMLREAGGLVKKSVGSLTYIVDNYENAPALQAINMDDIKILEDNEKKFIEDILSAFKHKTLGKFLGSLIIKLYKKMTLNRNQYGTQMIVG